MSSPMNPKNELLSEQNFFVTFCVFSLTLLHINIPKQVQISSIKVSSQLNHSIYLHCIYSSYVYYQNKTICSKLIFASQVMYPHLSSTVWTLNTYPRTRQTVSCSRHLGDDDDPPPTLTLKPPPVSGPRPACPPTVGFWLAEDARQMCGLTSTEIIKT